MAGLEFISYAYVAPFVEEALRQLLLARPELMGSHVGSNGRITVYVYICVCMYIPTSTKTHKIAGWSARTGF